jgi:DNA-3-methyladenine glycosylase II
MPICSRVVRETEASQLRPLVRVELPYLAPYDWDGVLSFFRNHRLPYVESVDALGYERVVPTNQGLGWFRVTRSKRSSRLDLDICGGGQEDVIRITAAVRRMFDLDSSPTGVHDALSSEPYLVNMWEQHRGLRVARSWSGAESIFTTVLGQLVSVKFASTLVDELMKTAGSKALHPKMSAAIHLFPTPEQILAADLSKVRTSESRRIAILSLARMFADGALNHESVISPAELRKTLLSVSGVGAWTAEYIAMRGFHDDDAFPSTDYGLKQELKRHPEIVINRVRPLRAYAAIALWKSFAESKRSAV